MAAELATSYSWSAAGGDGTRRGLFARTAAAVRPGLELPVQGPVQASAVIDASDNIFIADMAGGIQAFSTSGQSLWQTRLESGISASPCLDASATRLFVATHRGDVRALDPKCGRSAWRAQIRTASDPRILSDLLPWPAAKAVVLSSWGERFVALDEASGAEKFSWNSGPYPASGASLDPEGNVCCLRAVAKVGVQWVRVTPQGVEEVLLSRPEDPRGARRTVVTAAPVIDPGRGMAYLVVNGGRGASLLAWSFAEQKVLYERTLEWSVQATPALGPDGSLWLADLGGRVLGFTPELKDRCSYATGCEYMLAGGVCDGSGAFFIGDPVGTLHRIDSQGSGKRLFQSPRALQARPAFGPDGALWVPASNRTVYQFVA